MIEFFAFTWWLSRENYRDGRNETEGDFLFGLMLLPVVIAIAFAYLLYVGLEDWGVGALIRWTATLLSAVVVLAACLEERWWVAGGIAFGIGLLGTVLIGVAAILREKARVEEEEESSGVSGPGWRFS
jgi:hypothetical protein